MDDRVSEEMVAALKAAAESAERADDVARENANRAHSIVGSSTRMTGHDVATTRAAYLAAQAKLAEQKQAAADAATSAMVAANQRMADASEAAARSSAEAAEASKRAARWTAVAAVIAAGAVAVQAWQAYRPVPAPSAAATNQGNSGR